LALFEPFYGSCLGHALSKVCQYAITNEKMFIGLPYASIKVVPPAIQKYITWPKKLRKCKQAWEKTCIKYVVYNLEN
jgi:hypothetical protein